MKPGGHLIAFSGSRTYHRMAVAIEDAGFEIRDQIMWVYGSGFPKSHNISKGIDKSDAVEMRRQRDLKFTEWMRSTGITGKIINELTSSNMGNHYLTNKEQPTVATAEMFDKLRPHLPEVPDWVEQMVAERTIESENFKKREVVGVQEINGEEGTAGGYANGIASHNFDISVKRQINITAPATEAAKQWDGWGTALKPAHEPMVLARKPLIGTVANNVLTHGTGGLNIDGSRVDGREVSQSRGAKETSNTYSSISVSSLENAYPKDLGRWPANFIHDGSDEVVALFPNVKGATSRTNASREASENAMFGGGFAGTVFDDGLNTSAARFFYCAKASKRDRNEGLDGFPEIKGGSMSGIETREGKPTNHPVRANHHPTVKPTSLMQYLVRLVTPPNGTVLDPFMGSGSTGKACAYEGFDFIGIDQSAEYVAIAQARIDFALNDKLPL